ncbi:EamA family transporter [Thalassobaculum sp.]|uniref:EamA family transporter n=1 Tax=Thalassobaculum sp. TaxID=2022740 RepID=UPI0032EDA44C
MQGEAAVLALGAAGFFGLALVLTQFGLRHAAPVPGAAISVTTTAATFVAASPLLVDWTAAAVPAVLVFAAVGSLFPATVTMLTFRANQRLGPHVAGALGNLAPLFAVLLAAILLGEVPGPWQAVGIVVVLAGATTLVLGSSGSLGVAAWTAMLLPLAAALIRGAVQPVVKIGFETWADPFAAATIGYLVSAAVMLVTVTARGEVAVIRASRSGCLWFAAVGLCNGAAVVTMYAALARGPVALVAPLVASYPLATLAFGAILLRSARIGGRVALGVAVTVAGVALLLATR